MRRNRQPRYIAKRAFDVSVTGLLAPLWLPLVGVVALAIKAMEPTAPVFFSQARAGMRGEPFRMFKFRTMVPDAEELKEKLSHLNELAWPDFKIKEDPRITRLGRFLRRTSLDELPQLFNVLRGEMSLVGPRPTSFLADTYEPWQKTRLDCLPGVTGPWQITSRGEADFATRSRLDIRYLHGGNLLLDLLILAQTVGAVIGRRGA